MNTQKKSIRCAPRMKVLSHTFYLLILSLLAFSANAQTAERKWSLGIIGGVSVYAGNLGNNMAEFNYNVFRQDPTGGLTVSRYLNKSFNAVLMGTIGSFGYYNNSAIIFKGNMTQANFTLKYKLNNGYFIREDALIAPFIFIGAGAADFRGEWINPGQQYDLVAGTGLRLRLTEVFSLSYQATVGYLEGAHNNPMTNPNIAPTGNDKFMLHTIGLNINLGNGKDSDKDGVSDNADKCPGTASGVKVDAKGCPFDTDNDGVMDNDDRCPNMVGSVETKGCPDTDKDGVADIDDQCPNTAGEMNLQGCPDTDGDGMIDSKDKCPDQKGSVASQGCPDRDGDGIVDQEDNCPDVKGLSQFKGCPDSDNDGIEDSKDMCPNVKGPEATNGCPDTDNDGVNDGIDKCPALKGSPEHYGCPDTDGDGIFDDIDKCMTIPGVAKNQGCPEIKIETKRLFEKALQGIQFETGKATIKPISFPILNSIVKVMKDNPSYKLLIGGHTDNVGDDAMNMTLSLNRASAVANYLIAKGVDPMRVSAEGYGESKPVDTNDSVKGRTRNRRVELNVEFIQ